MKCKLFVPHTVKYVTHLENQLLAVNRDIVEISDGWGSSRSTATAQGFLRVSQLGERDQVLVVPWNASSATAEDLPVNHSCLYYIVVALIVAWFWFKRCKGPDTCLTVLYMTWNTGWSKKSGTLFKYSTQLNSTGYYGCRCKHLYIPIYVWNIF